MKTQFVHVFNYEDLHKLFAKPLEEINGGKKVKIVSIIPAMNVSKVNPMLDEFELQVKMEFTDNAKAST